MNRDQISKLSKKQTAMLGALIGDAMGMPHEFKEAHAINQTFIKHPLQITEEYKTYPVPGGRYTDDFSQQLCVEKHFRTYPVKSDAFYADLLNWSDGKYWVGGHKFDEGMQTASQLKYYDRYIEIKQNKPNQSGNGSLMRVLPVAFMDCTDDEAQVAAFLCSAITHNTDEAVHSCQFYVQLIRELLKDEPGDLWQRTAKRIGYDPYRPGYTPGTGYVIDSMCVLKDAFVDSWSFESAINNTIRIGGDTDTNACIVGGFAALVYGLTDLPDEWLEFIQPSFENQYVKELFSLA